MTRRIRPNMCQRNLEKKRLRRVADGLNHVLLKCSGAASDIVRVTGLVDQRVQTVAEILAVRAHDLNRYIGPKK